MTGRVLDPEVECAADLWPRQRDALRAALTRLQAHPLHGPGLAHLRPDQLRTPDDLRRLPLSRRADLQVQPPLAGHSVPPRELVRVHASSGSTGSRTLSGYTRTDLALWTQVVARGLVAVGVDDHSIVCSMLHHGLFTGGFGFHQAATFLGCTVIPAGTGRSHVHADLVRQLSPTVLFATPSYAQHLADRCGPLSVELGVFGAEPWSEADRARLEASWGMRARDTYGLSELIGPGVAFECDAGGGLHVNADAFVPEVVDADGQPVPDGTFGELVLSAPTRQARPLLRYRTGDRTALDRRPCPCGRTLPRIARIDGRLDDVRVVRGVNVHLHDVATALADHPADLGAWHLELSRPAALDQLALVVECPTPADPDLIQHLAAHLHDRLGLRVDVRTVARASLPHSGGKAPRWHDLRPAASGGAPQR